MENVVEVLLFGDYIDVDTHAVVRGVVAGEHIVSEDTSAEPVTASDDEEKEGRAPVRLSTRKSGLDARPPLFYSVLKKTKKRLSATFAC